MYYIGASIQVGTDFQLRKRLLLSSYFQFFSKKVNRIYPTDTEIGRFKTITAAALIQINTSAKLTRSFFLAGGICIQSWKDNFTNNYYGWDKQRTNLLPVARIGYYFPLGKLSMTIELNGTGPYSYQDGEWHSVEILTQLSFGTRFIF
jgi:hypothetical protein